MATATAPGGDSLIMKARGFTVMHHLEEAEALYQKILDASPDTPEALNFVAMCELGRGEFPAALGHLERALQLEPNEADLWKNRGIALLAQGRAQDAVDSFDRVLSMEPKSLAVRLHRAAAMERMGSTYDATAAYDSVLTLAQSGGRWRNAESTPPELRPLVEHAMRYVDRHRRQIFLDLLRPVRERYGAAALARVEQGLSIYLEEVIADYPDSRQSCSFFYIPRLSAEPLLDAAVVPGVAGFAAKRDVFRAELDAVIADPVGPEPYFGTHDLELLRNSGALDGGEGARLEAFFLYRRGEPESAGRRSCPRTARAVDELPRLVRVPNMGPDVFFAILAPDTHVMKSNGITNARISVEIPLKVAGRCVRSVAGRERPWREDACIAYDPSFEHELQSSGDGTSTALVLDAWHPGLSAAERAALTLLFDGIGEYNVAADVEAPF